MLFSFHIPSWKKKKTITILLTYFSYRYRYQHATNQIPKHPFPPKITASIHTSSGLAHALSLSLDQEVNRTQINPYRESESGRIDDDSVLGRPANINRASFLSLSLRNRRADLATRRRRPRTTTTTTTTPTTTTRPTRIPLNIAPRPPPFALACERARERERKARPDSYYSYREVRRAYIGRSPAWLGRCGEFFAVS